MKNMKPIHDTMNGAIEKLEALRDPRIKRVKDILEGAVEFADVGETKSVWIDYVAVQIVEDLDKIEGSNSLSKSVIPNKLP